MSSLIVIVNPVCGAGQGKEFAEEHVVPALKRPGLAHSAAVFTTETPGHAGEIVLNYLRDHELNSLTVVVASGDGTVHEIVNALEQNDQSYEIDLVLIPVGVLVPKRNRSIYS
jgi:diacylglycerol kinase family enzyme